MTSFFSKKQPIITFSCHDWAIRTHAPILPASEYIPQSFKDLPTGKICPFDTDKIFSNLTAKNCPAINNLLTTGYILPAWCDIEIDFQDDSITMKYSNSDYGHEIHTQDQFQSIIGDQFEVRLDVKLNSPWHIHTASNYSCMWIPIFHNNVNYQALPAILETDVNLNQNPINLMLFKPKKTLIKLGDPLVQIIPFKRENINGLSKSFSLTDQKRMKNILNLKKLSRFGWRKFIKDTPEYQLHRQDLDINE